MDKPTMNTPKKISTLYAFICTDDGEGAEGIPATLVDNMALPLVGADMERMESFRPVAVKTANAMGTSVELRKFSTFETIETINPESLS